MKSWTMELAEFANAIWLMSMHLDFLSWFQKASTGMHTKTDKKKMIRLFTTMKARTVYAHALKPGVWKISRKNKIKDTLMRQRTGVYVHHET